jgi:hypothetical protein
MANDFQEQKIVFKEGDDVRVLRGIIIREDDFFIYVKRNDGEKRIGKQFIIKIEGEKK